MAWVGVQDGQNAKTKAALNAAHAVLFPGGKRLGSPIRGNKHIQLSLGLLQLGAQSSYPGAQLDDFFSNIHTLNCGIDLAPSQELGVGINAKLLRL